MNTESAQLHETAAAWVRGGRSFVLATVVRTWGSAPRLPGAKLLIPAAGEALGTVGGGAAERQVLEAARELLARGEATRVLAVDLSAETACGGKMEIFLEAQSAGKSLALIGAGHVGRAVARLLAQLGWDVIVYDPREERLADPDFAACRTVAAEFLEAPDRIEFTEKLFVLIMTPDHKLDKEVAAACLDRPWRWLGVMGSTRKAREIREHLAARGLPAEGIARMRIPVGIEIGSDTPDEIAVSIAAELIRETSAKVESPAPRRDP